MEIQISKDNEISQLFGFISFKELFILLFYFINRIWNSKFDWITETTTMFNIRNNLKLFILLIFLFFTFVISDDRPERVDKLFEKYSYLIVDFAQLYF